MSSKIQSCGIDEKIENSVLCYVGNTPLIKIEVSPYIPDAVDIYAKLEYFNPGGSIKDRPVLRMIKEAIKSGELTHDKVILDSTSGNAGIAYSMIGAALGYNVELVMPGNASKERKQSIRAFGAHIITTDPIKGYDEAIRKAHELWNENPEKYFMPDQYANRHNPRAHYDTTGAEILAQTKGEITHFICGVGTGGTVMGVGRRLKEHNPDIEIHVIMPENFPGIEGLKPMGAEYIKPKIYHEEFIEDIRLPVTSEDAKEMCNLLSKEMGIFVGLSSGAFLKGALELAKEMREGTIVTIFPDTGSRYFSTQLWD
ncbi:MAG: cysteine synthase family protein [Candidatus Scalindua sp. AMX11]|nr:MAG: cysteine synthase family protein [Candidatus Scalindua sp.]NOG85371.1 cysteine synthase family protein [Planctomycetota bacterium]RZV83970.1 MAG: cysteine synthase family protein [Candidatus Scalindua sp. SCAELEC01]TDE65747.1 MAG: cysteine synthase family protein [Candidatus Scalindua sp. AMX11]GJQ59645.1 MAG: cysteine synthase [Candidatus Scalindua sp.]